MKNELKNLIEASRNYLEFQSIGNGAKLNCAIEAAEILFIKIIIKNKEEIGPEAMDLFERYIPITVAKELKEDFNDALLHHFAATATGWNMDIIPLANGYKFKRTKD
jgi:hypothetical protein